MWTCDPHVTDHAARQSEGTRSVSSGATNFYTVEAWSDTMERMARQSLDHKWVAL
jgi:hypothetical protein